MKGLISLLAALAALSTAALVLVAPAGATPPTHFRFALDPMTVVHEPCGAVEVINTTISGAEYFDAGGNSVRIQIHFDYDGLITLDGRAVRDEAHQNAMLTPSGINSLNGQGILFHLPGQGAVFQDVGHLVFSDLTGVTIASSAKVVGFDDPDAPDFSAAVCAALAT